jgi:PST family polysaccharide transporter
LVVTTDLGGLAIVIANVVQALVATSIEISAVDFRRWLSPKPWNWRRVTDIFRFGAPIGVEVVLSEAGRYWDKLMFSRLFGPHDTGMYSLAYNLSDLPATYVGEHVATVLFPTMVLIAPERRNQVFTEACGLLALIVMPMALGLASVADTLVKVLLTAEWQGVADFLVVLAAIAIFRPLNSVMSSLLIATGRTGTLMMFEVLRVTILFGGMWYFSRFGEVAAACALGVAMMAQFVGTLAVLTQRGFPALRFLIELRGPTLAAILMVAIVLVVRYLVSHWPGVPLVMQLIAEVAAGILAYLCGAWLLARDTFTKFVEIIQQQLGMRSSSIPTDADR